MIKQEEPVPRRKRDPEKLPKIGLDQPPGIQASCSAAQEEAEDITPEGEG